MSVDVIELDVDEDLAAVMSEVIADHTGPGVEPDPEGLWATLNEVGLARLTTPEADGGSEAGWPEAAALLRTLAGAGAQVPYAETDLLAAPLRRAAGLPAADGAETSTVAVLRADGTATSVPWAGRTTTITLLRRDGDRWAAAVVDAGDVEVSPTSAISAEPRADVRVDMGAVTWSPVAEDAVHRWVLVGAVVRAIQCVGAMEGMLSSSIRYTTEREQFGRSLARFQSVQNLVVDIAAETTLARAAVDAALADAVAHDLTGPRSAFKVAVARSCVSQALAVTVRNAHQAHGAIGTTHEHTLHRLTLPPLQYRGEFGSASFWEMGLASAALGDADDVWSFVVDGADLSDLPGRLATALTRA